MGRRSSGKESKSKAKDVVCERSGANNNQDNVLAQLLKYGPGGFLVGSDCLDGYRGGVISNCGRTAGDIDHATLVVGAGEENGHHTGLSRTVGVSPLESRAISGWHAYKPSAARQSWRNFRSL